jgi:hypothetical protein
MRYPTTHYPNAAAVRSDGLVAAGLYGPYEKDVYVFEAGGSTPIATYEFGHCRTRRRGPTPWAYDRPNPRPGLTCWLVWTRRNRTGDPLTIPAPRAGHDPELARVTYAVCRGGRGRAALRRQRLEHDEQHEADGVGEQRLVLRVDTVCAVDDRVRLNMTSRLGAAGGLPLESANERRPIMATYRARSALGRKP